MNGLFGPFFLTKQELLTVIIYLTDFEDGEFNFQQDGAPARYYRDVRAYIRNELIKTTNRWVGRRCLRKLSAFWTLYQRTFPVWMFQR